MAKRGRAECAGSVWAMYCPNGGSGRTDWKAQLMSKQDAITEDQLETFEGWLDYQRIDQRETSPEQLEALHDSFEEMKKQKAASPKLGRMNIKRDPKDKAYAVAIHKGNDLWVTLWVKHTARGDIYVFQPRHDGSWNPHASYHYKGQYHHKSYGRIVFKRTLQQIGRAHV